MNTGVPGISKISPDTGAEVSLHPFVPVAVTVVVYAPTALIVSELAVEPSYDHTFPLGIFDVRTTGVLQVVSDPVDEIDTDVV